MMKKNDMVTPPPAPPPADDLSEQTMRRLAMAQAAVHDAQWRGGAEAQHKARKELEAVEEQATRERARRGDARTAIADREYVVLELLAAAGKLQPGERGSFPRATAIDLVGSGLARGSLEPPPPKPAEPALRQVRLRMLDAFEQNAVGDTCHHPERLARRLVAAGRAVEVH